MDRPFLILTGCARLQDAGFLFASIQLGCSSLVCFSVFIAMICCRITDCNLMPSLIESLVMTLCLVSLLTSTMLMVGIKKQRHKFLLPWLYASTVLLTILILFSTFGFFVFFSSSGTKTAMVALFILVLIAGLGLGVYITYIIYSLYEQIKLSYQPPHEGP